MCSPYMQLLTQFSKRINIKCIPLTQQLHYKKILGKEYKNML